MRLIIFICTAMILLVTSVIPGFAAEVAGTKFSRMYDADGINLRLTGAGLFRYWGFKAYTGALYLEEGAPVEAVLNDTAKRIELEYFRAIKGEDFGPATVKVIGKNVDAETLERLRPQIDYHNSLYEDVQPGDRYSLTYIPGRGTELALNGEPKGLIKGDEFAQAVFSIWLGPRPIDNSFKQQILGL